MSNQTDFLDRLEAEAARQAVLHEHRVLPAQLDLLTGVIGRYAWQSCVVLAGLTAFFLEIMGWVVKV